MRNWYHIYTASCFWHHWLDIRFVRFVKDVIRRKVLHWVVTVLCLCVLNVERADQWHGCSALWYIFSPYLVELNGIRCNLSVNFFYLFSTVAMYFHVKSLLVFSWDVTPLMVSKYTCTKTCTWCTWFEIPSVQRDLYSPLMYQHIRWIFSVQLFWLFLCLCLLMWSFQSIRRFW